MSYGQRSMLVWVAQRREFFVMNCELWILCLNCTQSKLKLAISVSQVNEITFFWHKIKTNKARRRRHKSKDSTIIADTVWHTHKPPDHISKVPQQWNEKSIVSLDLNEIPLFVLVSYRKRTRDHSILKKLDNRAVIFLFSVAHRSHRFVISSYVRFERIEQM